MASKMKILMAQYNLSVLLTEFQLFPNRDTTIQRRNVMVQDFTIAKSIADKLY